MSFLRTPGVREAPNVATIADMPRPREDLERDIVRALRGIRGLDPVSDRERRTMLIRECAAMLERLSAERVAELRGKERRRVVALLRRVAERTERLLAE